MSASIAGYPVVQAGTWTVVVSSITAPVAVTQSGVWTVGTNADGSATGGAAALKSLLTGLLVATAAPVLTVGQQIALQGDTSGNLRVSPYGATGSFHVTANVGTGAAPPFVVVPNNVKWVLKSTLLFIQLASAATRQIIYTISTGGGSSISTNLTPVTGAINGNGYSCTFAPGMAQSAGYTTIFTSGYATTPFPELVLVGASQMALFVVGGIAGDVVQMNHNYIQVPD